MADHADNPADALSLDLVMEIDRLSDQFEQACEAGSQPEIEDYLNRAAESGRVSLLRRLLCAELEHRRGNGLPVDLNDYQQRFPYHQQLVADAFASYGNTASFDVECTTQHGLGGESQGVDGDAAFVGQTLGRYQLVSKLGQGGMGSVFAAEDTQLGRIVALKTPRIDRSADPQALERFYREAHAAASLRHPGICTVFDYGEEEGIPYLTMAYVSGSSLAEIMRERKVTERQAVELIQRIAAALAFAHSQGVIHRDLKPDNVLLDENDQPVIVDFGLARSLHGNLETLTRTGTVLGTPAYMSPEQAAGQSRAPGPPTDMYSLGVMMYEMLTGVRPFTGSAADIQGQHLYVAPKPLSSVNPDVDRRLEQICLKMLEKKPEDRVESMQRLQERLDDWLSHRDGLAELENARGVLSWKPVAGLLGGAAALFYFCWTYWTAFRPPKYVDPIDLLFDLACIGPFVLSGIGCLVLAAWYVIRTIRKT